MTSKPITQQSILFVTGRLSEVSLREIVTELSEQLGFRYEVAFPEFRLLRCCT